MRVIWARSGDGGATALGWVVVNDAPDEFEIRPAEDRLPGLLFVPVSDTKTTKNRLHIDLRPDEQDAEVQRLSQLGGHVSTSARVSSRGSCSPTRRATSSAS